MRSIKMTSVLLRKVVVVILVKILPRTKLEAFVRDIRALIYHIFFMAKKCWPPRWQPYIIYISLFISSKEFASLSSTRIFLILKKSSYKYITGNRDIDKKHFTFSG